MNEEIVRFNQRLYRYNHFWSPYLSMYFLVHTVMIAYFAYALLLDFSSFEFLARSYFIFFLVELTLIMLLLTGECSRIVQYNVSLYRANAKFSFQFQHTFVLDKVNLVKVIHVYVLDLCILKNIDVEKHRWTARMVTIEAHGMASG